MTTPQWNPNQQYYPPVLPPDIEWLAQYFLTPILTPTPVKTQLPKPTATQVSYPNGFMRIEAGDTTPVRNVYNAAFDCIFLMHAYSPNEVQASAISRLAAANVCAATGLTISNWYIVDVLNYVGGRRLSDPEIPTNLVRYRSAVTWRIAGQPPEITT